MEGIEFTKVESCCNCGHSTYAVEFFQELGWKRMCYEKKIIFSTDDIDDAKRMFFDLGITMTENPSHLVKCPDWQAAQGDGDEGVA